MAMMGQGQLLKSGRRRSPLMSEINVTPMVDVMLVLLIIFMITSPMLVSGVTVDLPDSSTNPISGQDEPLSVTVDRNGKIYIMDTVIKGAELIPKLKAITKQNYTTRIFVRGDKSVSYGKVISVVADINAAGFSKVALITTVKKDDQ